MMNGRRAFYNWDKGRDDVWLIGQWVCVPDRDRSSGREPTVLVR